MCTVLLFGPWEPFYSAHGAAALLLSQSSCSGGRDHQIAYAHQIVSGQCEVEHPTDPSHSPVPSLTQTGDGLAPAEDFFDALAFLLTNRVARMTSGAIINNAGGLARNMWRHLVVAQLLHKLFAVIAFVGTECDPAAAPGSCSSI